MRRQDLTSCAVRLSRPLPTWGVAVLCAVLAAIILPAASAPAGVLTVTDNLVTHFDAALGTYTDNGVTPASNGDDVQWWDDQATAIAGNNAAQQAYNKPTLQAGVLNGLPVLHFGGGSDNLLVLDGGAGGSSSPVGTALDTNTISWFAVVSKTGTATQSVLRAKTVEGGDNRWGSFYQDGQYYSHSRNSGGTFVGSSNVALTDTFVVLSAVWDGSDPNSTVQQWLNGTAGNLATGATQTGTFDRFRIGNTSNANSGLTGDIAEVLVYNAALSSPDRRSVEDYLYTKYFVSGPPRVNDYPLANNLRLHATGDTRDVTATTVLDTVGTPQNGTIVGTVGNPAGRIHEALSFSGSDSNYVNFGDVFDPGTDSFTVSLWFNPDDASRTQFLAGKGNASSANVGWGIWMGGGDLYVRGQQVGGGGNDRFGQHIDDVLTAGQWHNVVLVIDRDTDTIRGYLDGSNEDWLAGGGGAQTDSLISGSNIATTDLLYVGRRWTGGAPFNGLIDDLAIWDRALSPNEVERLYVKGLQGFDAATIPEPATWILLGLGAIGLLGVRRRGRRN